MIKLSLPAYDPNRGLTFRITFYATWYDLGQSGRGMGPRESVGDWLWDADGRLHQSGISVTMLNATNEFASFYEDVSPSGLDAPASAGPYVVNIEADTARNGLDGTTGWFSLVGSRVEVTDVQVAYTAPDDSGERGAGGHFV